MTVGTPTVLWRCTHCHNKASPDVMNLGRCPTCQTTWGMRHRPTAVEMFRAYAASRHGECLDEAK